MATIDKATIKRLAKLCRIACSEEQEDALLHDMQKIIGYVEQLSEINTDAIVPCNYVASTLSQTPFRADVPGQTLSRDEFLKNAPAHIGGMIRVPPVLRQE